MAMLGLRFAPTQPTLACMKNAVNVVVVGWVRP